MDTACYALVARASFPRQRRSLFELSRYRPLLQALPPTFFLFMVAAFSPNVPPDHGGDVFLLTTSTRHMAQNAQPLAVREPSLYSWYYLNGPFYVYSQDQDPQRPFFRPIRLRRRLRSGFLPVVHHPQRPGAHGAIWRGHDHLRNTNPTTILGRLWKVSSLTDFPHGPFEHTVRA